MDEDAARRVLLVRALETDRATTLISDEDRRHAARAAAELVRWQASSRRSAATDDQFIARRADLLLDQLAVRQPSIARAARSFQWRPWIGIALPVFAFIAGLISEQIGDRQRVSLLAFPLLLLIVWNVAIYLLLVVRTLARLNQRGTDRDGPPGVFRRALVAVAERGQRSARGNLAPALTSFAASWARINGTLLEARAARVLHWSAALFGVGAVVGLYARGLVFDYRVGWESTFLSAADVHALFSWLLAPASSLLQLPLPDVAEVEALRFGAPGSAPASAARWIHLYAASVAIWVIVPRLLLGLFAYLIELRYRTHVRLDLSEPYFRRLLGAGGGGSAARVRVVPYSYRVGESAMPQLTAIARALFGEQGQAELRPTVEVGDEARAGDGLSNSGDEVSLTLALFNLAATPEHESHGAFLQRLREHVASPLAVLIDQAPLMARLGSQTGRIEERRSAWLAFCAAHDVVASIIDLNAPDLARVEQELTPAVTR